MPNSEIQEIMAADDAGNRLVSFANREGEVLSKSLKRAQIRSIFTEARNIEAIWASDADTALRRLSLLRPKLAYQAKRNREVEPLQRILTDAIEEVVNGPKEKRAVRFNRFMDLFEAILAYHRYHGGS